LFIEGTIQSVVNQTVRPLRWVIVSDGSTDGTDEIVQKYARAYSWIELVRLPERGDRHFAGKVYAFNAGYAKMADERYDIIGNLDADIAFDATYFAFLLSKFAANARLGVAGTPFVENRDSGRRREYGGIDLIAVITARMKGWETRSFLEKTCTHHRAMGTAQQHALMVAYRGGRGDFMLGGHPLWEFCRCIYQMTRRPYVLAGLYRLAGFTQAMASRADKLVATDVVRFRRAEQMKRLREFLWKTVSLEAFRVRNIS
jgi:glycosyltransferase involved in cell wall biosynthesis